MIQAFRASEVLNSINNFKDRVQSPDYILNILLSEFAIVEFDALKEFEYTHFQIAIGTTAKRLTEWVFFPALKQFIYSLPLTEEYEAVNVGFGVIVRPTDISKALLVINNTTISLSKQRLLETIIKTLQAQEFAHKAEPFFFSHLSLVFENLIQRVSFNENDVTNEIIVPLLHTLMKLILEKEIDHAYFGVSDLEFNLLLEIRKSAEDLITSKSFLGGQIERCLGFIKAYDLHGSANLNYELFSLSTKDIV